MCHLFTPMPFGAINLSHRIVTTPHPDLASDRLRRYAACSTRGGLMIAQAATVSGSKTSGVSEIFQDSHTQMWRTIVDAVHARGGKILLPLHHPAPAAENLIDSFRGAAQRARDADFDGVEIIGSDSYLLTNCIHLLLDIAAAAISVWGRGRVGLRVAGTDEALAPLAAGMDRFDRSFLHVVGAPAQWGQVRRWFQGRVIADAGLSPEAAEPLIAGGAIDLVVSHLPADSCTLPRHSTEGRFSTPWSATI